MCESKKITLLDLKTQYKMGLRIPEIQRDFVMGAGGKDGDGKDKLNKLLDAILAKCKERKDFDFSCIITYCSDAENTPLEIYDGQQRLTTLMIMILYKLREEKKDVTRFAKWYSFAGRPNAIEIFNLLTQNESKIEDIIVTDFTSFSIKNLLEKISLPKYKDISSDYLSNQVKFDMVSIGSQNEIEQFFMDLNSGVKLKDYELYKAKLTHHVGQLKKENAIESLEMWPHKMDNEWLNFFDIFADYEHPAEEYEVAFVKYCINMVCMDIETGFKKFLEDKEIDRITSEEIKQVYDIMQMVTKLNLKVFKGNDIPNGILHYSWKKSDSNIINLRNYDRRGAFWNLAFEEYDRVLYYIIKVVLLNEDKKNNIDNELEQDVLLWCFITTLDWQVDFQNEYLRLIKIILNHNVFENENAWYECQNNKGQYLYYCKYSVYAIPQYYGEHIKNHPWLFEFRPRLTGVFLFNKEVIQNIKTSNIWNREEIANWLMKQIKDFLIKDTLIKNEKHKECIQFIQSIKSIIGSRILLLQKNQYKEKFIEHENAVFGIIDKIENPIKDGYYLGKVNLRWPTRSGSLPEVCWIRLKCATDLLFSQFDHANNEIVEKTINKMMREEKMREEKIIEEFIDKCFWSKDQHEVYKLYDRVTPTSTTYNKKGSDSDWKNTWKF